MIVYLEYLEHIKNTAITWSDDPLNNQQNRYKLNIRYWIIPNNIPNNRSHG